MKKTTGMWDIARSIKRKNPEFSTVNIDLIYQIEMQAFSEINRVLIDENRPVVVKGFGRFTPTFKINAKGRSKSGFYTRIDFKASRATRSYRHKMAGVHYQKKLNSQQN